MMKLKLKINCLLLIGLIFMLGSANLAALATIPYLNTDASSSSLQYGAGNKASLRFDNLSIQSIYILEVAINTNASYNITWTAYSTSALVDFNYNGPLLDIYNNSLTQIELLLYDNSTSTTILTYYMILQQSSSLAGALSWISSMAVVFIYALIGIVLFAIAFKIVTSFTK